MRNRLLGLLASAALLTGGAALANDQVAGTPSQQSSAS